MRATSHLFVLCIGCALTAAQPAWSADALTHRAALLYDEGSAAYKQSKWADARASFLAAWGIKMHWQIAASLGDCEVQLGLYRDAAEHLAYALRNAPAEQQTAEMKQLYATARTKIGTLVITVDVLGADVAVDGKVIGKAPLEDPVFVTPGPHAVEARFRTHAAAEQVEAGAGTSRTLALSVIEKRPLWPAIAAGSAGVVAVGVGAGLAAVASGKQADVNTLGTKVGPGPVCSGTPGANNKTTCQTLATDAVGHDTLTRAALGSFIAGGALALTAAGLGVWAATGPKDGKTSVRAVPVLGHGQAGVVVVGTW
jgi:hypothetical protein